MAQTSFVVHVTRRQIVAWSFSLAWECARSGRLADAAIVVAALASFLVRDAFRALWHGA